MRTKMKGTFKAGFKYISSIFVMKEPEIEIGYPTDVKHVAHIGWDGQSGAAPSWMKEFKTGPDFASTSIGKSGFGESMRKQSGSEFCSNNTPLPNEIPKKQKRKKTKSNCSGSSSSLMGSSRPGKSNKFVQGNPNSANVEIAMC